MDESSSHVYSVQPSIPKDPAALWTPDFVQAEELFNRPPEEENCLRDNRYGMGAASMLPGWKATGLHAGSASNGVCESHRISLHTQQRSAGDFSKAAERSASNATHISGTVIANHKS